MALYYTGNHAFVSFGQHNAGVDPKDPGDFGSIQQWAVRATRLMKEVTPFIVTQSQWAPSHVMAIWRFQGLVDMASTGNRPPAEFHHLPVEFTIQPNLVDFPLKFYRCYGFVEYL